MVVIAPAGAQTGDVDVQLDQFGAGNRFRPGDVTAIALRLTSALPEPTPCFVQWEMPNVDGDIAEYGRVVTLTPGAPTRTWLYGPLPPQITPESVFTVRIFEFRDERRRREIGGARISPSQVGAQLFGIEKSLIAIVGSARMGLDDYGNTWPMRRETPPGANVDTRLVPGLSPSELPDRWEGLRPFEAIAWADALPQDLRLDSANALREYVERGGHLIITLPAAGNPWGLGALGKTELEDLLPHHAPRKDEGVLLSEVLPVLSKSQHARRDIELSIRVFKEIHGSFDALDSHYEPLIALPDGRVVVIQRVYGFGRVTVIGIDLTSRQLTSMGLPQADRFWNRILGRRNDTPQADEVRALEEAGRLARQSPNQATVGSGRLFVQQISMTRRAGQGLILALLLFIVYFLVAGPGGYHLLKRRGLLRHAWLGFVAAAGVFTAIAWGGVALMRQHDVTVKHVTFLDHIARAPDDLLDREPQLQRATSWMSIHLPGYGKSHVEIDSAPGRRDLLLSWTPPGEVVPKFPNVDRYMIDVGRSPASYKLPSRSTATQMYAHWLGGLDPAWGGLLRIDPDDPVCVAGDASGRLSLTGTIINELPGTLSNVQVIWVENRRRRPKAYTTARDGEEFPWVPRQLSGDMLNFGRMWSKPRWEQGTAFDLAELDLKGRTDLESNIYGRYIEDFESPRYSVLTSRQLSEGEQRRYMEMLSIYHQLTPPKYLKPPTGDQELDIVVVRRELGQELDLSPWLTRPCLIIIGYLEGSPTPVPLRVDGEIPASEGRTIVRWIYPLELEEETAFPKPREG